MTKNIIVCADNFSEDNGIEVMYESTEEITQEKFLEVVKSSISDGAIDGELGDEEKEYFENLFTPFSSENDNFDCLIVEDGYVYIDDTSCKTREFPGTTMFKLISVEF